MFAEIFQVTYIVKSIGLHYSISLRAINFPVHGKFTCAYNVDVFELLGFI